MAVSKRNKSSTNSLARGADPASGPGGGEETTPFEESMRRLSDIVDELESGELSLEESLARFEEGVRLARASQSRLDEAEAKVEVLLSVDEDGKALTEEIEQP